MWGTMNDVLDRTPWVEPLPHRFDRGARLRSGRGIVRPAGKVGVRSQHPDTAAVQGQGMRSECLEFLAVKVLQSMVGGRINIEKAAALAGLMSED